MSTLLNALIKTIRHEAEGIVSIELVPAAGSAEFPPFEAGSHIDLHLPNGMIRNYSLLNSSEERARYVIGVLQDAKSRGGSKYVHEQLRVGRTIPITPPRNNFPLVEGAKQSVLIAGGIGVTPILSMARRLAALGKPFEVLYYARSRQHAAFLDELAAAFGERVTARFDDEAGGPPDLRAAIAARVRPGTHYYACGPAPLLDAFEKACAGLGLAAEAHVERFAALEIDPAADAKASYVCELSRSGKTFTITPEKSLLDTLLDGGVQVNYSCMEGVCGTCETGVIEGEPDHRDSVLSASEKASNRTMMICVSGCRSERLVLDL